MATIQKQTCDQCGKETADRYDEVGWVNLNPMPDITIHLGRKKDRTGRTAFFGRRNAGQLDFCCVGCLTKFLEKLRAN